MAESRSELNLGPKKRLLDEWSKEYRDPWQAYAESLIDRWNHRDRPTRSEIQCAIIGIRPITKSYYQDKQAKDITKLLHHLKGML